MTAATPLARYSAMGIGALREQLRYRQNLHHLSGHDPTAANHPTGRDSTYPAPIPVQTNPATAQFRAT